MAYAQARASNDEARVRIAKLKRFSKWVFWTAVIIAFIYGVIWLARSGAREQLGVAYPSQGGAHIEAGTAHPAYNSNPPTSGWHYANEANWGIYQTELPDENLLHNLEHGGIWISYSGVDEETIAKIETLAKQYPNKIVVEPRSKNDAKIVLASWTRLLKLDAFDEAAIINFIKSNKNRSPEPNAL